jgi:hypothetical protein
VTRDAKESLTALVAVSSYVGIFCLALLIIPNDLDIPRWVTWVGAGVAFVVLAGHLARRLRLMGKLRGGL